MRLVLLASAVAGLSLVGCAHTRPPETTETSARSMPVAVAPPAPQPVAAPAAPGKPQDDLAAMLSGATIGFDFDSTTLTRDSQARLSQIADHLRAHPELGVKVAGNCDERGTEEYNLSLGSKRAEVAKKFLTELGVDPMRVQTISYGKERPVDQGHDEAAYARNRRADVQPLQGKL